jgi:Amt family ammonium transporter
MSVPGLVILYGGVMQKRWSVNSMMMAFVAFALVLIAWVLWEFKMGFGSPIHFFGTKNHEFFGNFLGIPGSVLGQVAEEGRAHIPLLQGVIPDFKFPQSSLVYFQFVFAAITPILMLGSVLGRINFKAWIPFVLIWSTVCYSVGAFLIWGGGFFGASGALDYSGGYVIHLAAGVSGFVAAAVIGPRLQRDREIDAPNNLLMVAAGAGFLWLGWNGFNGGDPYFAGANSSAAVLNTNLSTAVALLVWIVWDYIGRDKPSLIGSVNAMITGLVAITPAAGYVNGYGAMAIGAIGATVVWLSIRFLSRAPVFRRVDDTLGVVYTHGIAGLTGGLLVGILAEPNMIIYPGTGSTASATPFPSAIHGHWTLLKWQALAALFIIVFDAVFTFLILKLISVFVPLRLSDEELEIGDHAIHGNEVYPSDVPSLGGPHAPPWRPAPAAGLATTAEALE